MFRQTGFLPPQVGTFFGQKENFFRANRCRPPKFGRARTPMPTRDNNSVNILQKFRLMPSRRNETLVTSMLK